MSPISIHLMLLFITAATPELLKVCPFQYISCYCLSMADRGIVVEEKISIHLMLLFIITLPTTSISFNYFNTSHVTVYQFFRFQHPKKNVISIHLMLLFIITFIGILPIDFHFNTSHVTVYPDRLFEQPTISLFQYISCYCLSFSSISITALICISIHLMLLFIQLPDSMRFIKD